MTALALVLTAAVAGAPPFAPGAASRLDRRPPSGATSTTAPAFLRTDLERELWDAVVLLEGDVETATVARASCETALAEALDIAAVPLVAPSSPALEDGAIARWVWPALALTLAATTGLALGLWLEERSDRP